MSISLSDNEIPARVILPECIENDPVLRRKFLDILYGYPQETEE